MNGRTVAIAGVLVAIVLLVIGLVLLQAGKVEEVTIYTLPEKGDRVPVVEEIIRSRYPSEAQEEETTVSVATVVESSFDTVRYEAFNEPEPRIDEAETVQQAGIDETVNADAAALNPPTPPTRGLIDLIESIPDDATYAEFEARFMEYTLTYYPLTMLEPHEIALLDPEAKAAYERQQAASHKEAMDMIREDFASASPEMLGMLTAEMRDLFEKEGILP